MSAPEAHDPQLPCGIDRTTCELVKRSLKREWKKLHLGSVLHSKHCTHKQRTMQVCIPLQGAPRAGTKFSQHSVWNCDQSHVLIRDSGVIWAVLLDTSGERVRISHGRFFARAEEHGRPGLSSCCALQEVALRSNLRNLSCARDANSASLKARFWARTPLARGPGLSPTARGWYNR
mgnify:CR=1 FL=1